MHTTPRKSDEAATWMAGILLAAMPVASFVLQYLFDHAPGRWLFQHPTITFVDWVFVPFNLLVVHVIDWRRGGRLFAITVLCAVANAATHAFWQYHVADPGHMFSAERVVLPAGWVHLMYSTLQTILVAAFVFARRNEPRFSGATTILALIYLAGAGAGGYLMNHGVMIADGAMVLSGLTGVVIYPRLARHAAAPSRSGAVGLVRPHCRQCRRLSVR